MKDGIINLDSKNGNKLGFTSDNFDGYLWKQGDDIWISVIISKNSGKGNLSRLFKAILHKGYNIKVPTPFSKMEAILRNHGFEFTKEVDAKFGEVEVWVKKANKKRVR